MPLPVLSVIVCPSHRPYTLSPLSGALKNVPALCFCPCPQLNALHGSVSELRSALEHRSTLDRTAGTLPPPDARVLQIEELQESHAGPAGQGSLHVQGDSNTALEEELRNQIEVGVVLQTTPLGLCSSLAVLDSLVNRHHGTQPSARIM